MRRCLVLVLTLFGLFCLRAGSADAAQCTLPYKIQQGTIPNATQIMGNFNALLGCVNAGGGGGGGGGGGAVFTCSNTPGICPFSIPMFWPGIPPANQVVRISLTDTVSCPAGLPNSEGAAKTAATGSPVVNIYQVVSGTPTLRATATFTGGTPAFVAASAFNLALGDVIQYQFPSSPDATMADVSLTLHCNRTSGSAVGSAGAPLNDGNIWVGNPTGVAQAQVPSGDVTMTDSGIFSVLKVHGVSYPGSPTANQVPIASGGASVVYGFIPNASLINSATTINGTICTLGGSCTVSSGTTAITVGTTTVTGGTSGRVLYDNAAILGELGTTGTGNVVLASALTGSGNAVLATSPTISGLTVTGSLSATGLVTNADLVNPATTVNGQTCTLGSTCIVTAVASAMAVGTTTITSGTGGRILYDNGGILGELAPTGSGNVVLATNPSISGLTVTGSLIALGLVTNDDLVNPATDVNGQICTLGSACTVPVVTSVGCGAGLTGGTITTSGTCALDLTSNNPWTGVQAFGEVHGTTQAVTLTSNNYNVAITDCGKTKLLPTGTAPTVTLPNNMNPSNQNCSIKFITTVAQSYWFNVASGGSKQNTLSLYNTRGLWPGDTVIADLVTPSVSAAGWNISGDVVSSAFTKSTCAATVALSNGGLTASVSAGNSWQGCRSQPAGYISGKRYFEVTVTALDPIQGVQYGVANTTASLTTFFGFDTNGVGVVASGNVLFNSATYSGVATACEQASPPWTVGMAVNIGVEFWCTKDGTTWAPSGGNPSTPGSGFNYVASISGAVYPVISLYGDGTDTVTLATTSAQFARAPPTGFLAWDQ